MQDEIILQHFLEFFFFVQSSCDGVLKADMSHDEAKETDNIRTPMAQGNTGSHKQRRELT